MWNPKYNEELLRRRTLASLGGGEGKNDIQHKKGKLTAHERLSYLFDEGSFVELNTLMESQSTNFGMNKKRIVGDGVVIGYGNINGRVVCASAQDFTVIGGTLGEYHSKKICHIMDMAMKIKVPYISINDSGGARIEEGISSLDGYSGIFYRNTMASGVIPQISVVLGPCAGGACYSPAITDFVFMAKRTSYMFITGPTVVKTVLGEEISAEELGGADVHYTESGVAHFVYDDDKQCLDAVKKLLSYLPQNFMELPLKSEAKLNDSRVLFEELVPDNQKKPYDMKAVIYKLADKDSFFEIQPEFAKNIIIGFVRIDGFVVGVVANNPIGAIVGSLDIDASEKAARFVRLCDCFNIPILTVVDVPGFMPGKDQEHSGIIRKGAKLLYAYSEATVPKITLILRKAFGGAYIAMNSKGMGADIVFAWPISQTAVLGAEGAVSIIHRKQISNSEFSEQEKEKLIKDYEREYMNPYIAAEKGYIDEVIFPEETHLKISNALKLLSQKDIKKSIVMVIYHYDWGGFFGQAHSKRNLPKVFKEII